jgi:ABC-type nitrate/sulfonate/bicarbonate transport system ATPase subunit/ABC-type transporter Mla maintaining outer membrane lipid asymmetry permease subunit MlaE
MRGAVYAAAARQMVKPRMDRPTRAERPSALQARGLRILLPDGRVLVEDFSMEVAPGEVAVLLGGSGAGKSTFARLLFEPEELARSGFEVVGGELLFDRGQLALVPQRGALFDHLDVRGNIDLALRYAGRSDADPAQWLERVGLDRALAERGVPVDRLSGGQAQRVAVARTLASRRRLLLLDEPSVGLDPYRVQMLARLVRQEVRELDLAAIVVTHDVALAADVGDRFYMLDPASRRVEPLFAGQGPAPLQPEQRGEWQARLESALVERIARADAQPGTEPARRRSALRRALRRIAGAADRLLEPFRVAAIAPVAGLGQLVRRPRDFIAIAGRASTQTLLRPALFYAVVSLLIGYTVLYVISRVGGAGVRPDALVRQIGGSYVVALAPPLSAMLFVAASGSATNAWLGAMDLSKQTVALEALGVRRTSYLFGPAWFAVALSYLAVAALFAAGMVMGGLLLCRQYGMTGGLELLAGDLVDPRPERMRYAVRAGFLVWVYAWGLASDVVAKGGARKADADSVTRAMTGSVVASTLWVVGWELVTVLVIL